MEARQRGLVALGLIVVILGAGNTVGDAGGQSIIVEGVPPLLIEGFVSDNLYVILSAAGDVILGSDVPAQYSNLVVERIHAMGWSPMRA